MAIPHTMTAQHRRTTVSRLDSRPEAVAHTATHTEEDHSAEDMRTGDEELLRTIRISARHRPKVPPNSRTAPSSSTSRTRPLKPQAPRALRRLGQRRCRLLTRDKTAHRRKPNSFAQLSHRQVPQTISTSQDCLLRDTSNFCLGVCTRHGCPLVHDPNKQALCKRWLFKNDCNRGDRCSLSHEPTPHNVPTCLHFQEGRCTNEECRFAHIRVNPAAQICDAFGRLGYCEKGATCADLHAYECPDFANKGECIRGDKCQHRHVHRASRMRKPAGNSSPEERSRAASTEVESANVKMQEIIPEALEAPQMFTQQVDYVPFDVED
jgi:hypothetical protein